MDLINSYNIDVLPVKIEIVRKMQRINRKMKEKKREIVLPAYVSNKISHPILNNEQ